MTHPFAETTSALYETVGRVQDWEDGQAREVKAHKKPMTVVRKGENFFALNSICPHMGGPLSCGIVQDGKLSCPWHGWMFDVESGACANGHRIETYDVIVENGEVKVGWVCRT